MAQGRENTECLKEQVNAVAPGELMVGSIEWSFISYPTVTDTVP